MLNAECLLLLACVVLCLVFVIMPFCASYVCQHLGNRTCCPRPLVSALDISRTAVMGPPLLSSFELRMQPVQYDEWIYLWCFPGGSPPLDLIGFIHVLVYLSPAM
jgi:hypothetical protein